MSEFIRAMKRDRSDKRSRRLGCACINRYSISGWVSANVAKGVVQNVPTLPTNTVLSSWSKDGECFIVLAY